MATAPTPAPATPAAMRLSVWLDAAAQWHARLVLPDTRVLDFDSPFLLAQYLGRAAAPAPPAMPMAPGGLR